MNGSSKMVVLPPERPSTRMKVLLTLLCASLFGIFVFWILASQHVSAPTLIDSYSEAHHRNATVSFNDYRTKIGQVFTPSVSAYLRSCKFYISKENSPTGTIVAKLYTVNGTPGSTAVATGSPLAVSAEVNVSTLSPWPKLALADVRLYTQRVPYDRWRTLCDRHGVLGRQFDKYGSRWQRQCRNTSWPQDRR